MNWYELIIGVYAGCITPFAIIGMFEVYWTRQRRLGRMQDK